jgi:hypothetical protein
MIYLYFYIVCLTVPMPKHICEGVCILSFSQQAVHSTDLAGGLSHTKLFLHSVKEKVLSVLVAEVHSFSLYPVSLLTRLFQLTYSSCILKTNIWLWI